MVYFSQGFQIPPLIYVLKTVKTISLIYRSLGFIEPGQKNTYLSQHLDTSRRFFHTTQHKNSSNNSNKNNSQYTKDLFKDRVAPVVPVVVYRNADLDKLRIMNDNKGKSGVYR